MSNIRSLSLFAIFTALAFVAVPKSQAASGTWAAASNGNWDLDSNWVGSIEAEGAGFTASIPYNITVTLAGVSQTIGTLTLGTTAAVNSTLQATGGAGLTMNNSGTQALIEKGQGTLSAPLFLTDGGLKISTLGTSLTLSGAISSSAFSGTQALTLAHNGGGNQFAVQSVISDGNSGGVVQLIVDKDTAAAGAVVLSGSNSFTGGILIREGSLSGTIDSFNGNDIALGDGLAAANVSLSFASTGTFSNNITVNSGGSGTVTLGASGVNPVLAGAIVLGRNTTLQANNSAEVTISGNVSGTGSLNLVNQSAGNSTVTLSGSNSFSGGLENADELMRINIGSATAPGTGTWGIGHVTRNEAYDLRIDNVSGSAMTLANNNVLRLANFTFVGSNNLNMGTGDVTIGPATAIMTVLSNTLTVGGVISGNTTKNVGNAGPGTLVLTGANTYAGDTFVGGNMVVSSLANGGIASNIGASTSAADNLVLNRGALQYTGTGATTDRLFTVGNGGGTIDSSGTGDLVFNNVGAIVSTDEVVLAFGNGNATFPTGSSIINVGPSTSANTTANLAVGQGITGTNIAPGTVITAILDGSRIAISTPTTGASVSGPYTFAAIDRTLTLSGTNAGNNTIAGVLANSATKTLGVNKSGTGKWALSGSNTYSGATTVTAGTLVLSTAGSNNIANSTRITVQSGANLDVTGVTGGFTLASGQTVEGNGTVVGNLTVASNSTLSPGNSPGTLNQTGNQTWLDGGNYNWQIYDATGLAGAGYDTVAITGLLDLTSLTGGTDFNINLWSLSSIGPDVNGDAINFSEITQSWTLVTASGGITGFDATEFSINTTAANGTSGFSNSFAGTFSVSVSGTDLLLNYTAVPEPGTAALLVTGVGMFLLRKRRRCRS